MIDVIVGLAVVLVAAAVIFGVLHGTTAQPQLTASQHSHLWGEPAYDYTGPRALGQQERDSMLSAGLGASVERADLGFTTVSKRCSVCGEIVSELHLGRVSAR